MYNKARQRHTKVISNEISQTPPLIYTPSDKKGSHIHTNVPFTQSWNVQGRPSVENQK